MKPVGDSAMKRAREWLFNGVTILSLGLLVAAIATCVWTYSLPPSWDWDYSVRSGDQISILKLSALSFHGGFTAEVDLDSGFWGNGIVTARAYMPNIIPSTWAIHFEYGVFKVPIDGTFRYIRAAIPYWFAFMVLMLAPALRIVLFFKSPRPEPGHCKICGYDLRATPNQCPECGTPVVGSGNSLTT
jgi:hypothetical protein